MDVATLIREEWSTLLLLAGGVLGAYAAAGTGEWQWVAISLALALTSLRVLQAEGWILQDAVIGD